MSRALWKRTRLNIELSRDWFEIRSKLYDYEVPIRSYLKVVPRISQASHLSHCGVTRLGDMVATAKPREPSFSPSEGEGHIRSHMIGDAVGEVSYE